MPHFSRVPEPWKSFLGELDRRQLRRPVWIACADLWPSKLATSRIRRTCQGEDRALFVGSSGTHRSLRHTLLPRMEGPASSTRAASRSGIGPPRRPRFPLRGSVHLVTAICLEGQMDCLARRSYWRRDRFDTLGLCRGDSCSQRPRRRLRGRARDACNHGNPLRSNVGHPRSHAHFMVGKPDCFEYCIRPDPQMAACCSQRDGCGGRFVRTEGSLCSPATSGGRMALALGRRRDAEPLAWQALKDSSAYFPLHPSKARHGIAPTVSLTAELEEILHAHA